MKPTIDRKYELVIKSGSMKKLQEIGAMASFVVDSNIEDTDIAVFFEALDNILLNLNYLLDRKGIEMPTMIGEIIVGIANKYLHPPKKEDDI